MKLVIPMAGLGTRMRPHTWHAPSLCSCSWPAHTGLHILERFRVCPSSSVFIVGWLGEQTRSYAEEHCDVPTAFVTQDKMLGQAHAVWLAREHLVGPLFLMWVDTLFYETDLSGLDDPGLDGMVFTKQVDDPRRFGVVEVDATGRVTKLIEKPDSVDNKTVLMGLYYFPRWRGAVQGCKQLMDRRLKTKGEYYLADAISPEVEQGANFAREKSASGRDIGTPETTLDTMRYVLEHGDDNSLWRRGPAWPSSPGLHRSGRHCGTFHRGTVCLDREGSPD